MIIQILSDTHGYDYSFSESAQVIVHAGDFSNGLHGVFEFIEKCKNENKIPLFCLGNHDYYSKDINHIFKFFKDNPQYHCVAHNNTVEIEGYTFIGGTLFSNFRSNDYDFSEQDTTDLNKKLSAGLLDFWSILKGPKTFVKPNDYHFYFNQTYNNILKYKNKNRVIVVTHFPPNIICSDPRYDGSHLNPYFINNVSVKGFKLWISGHTHTAVDTIKDDCRLVINPLGYPPEHDVNGFIKHKLIDLKDIFI